MGRLYRVPFELVTVSAAQDMLQIKGAAGKMLFIRKILWKPGDNTLATAQVLPTRARFLPATVTDGTGGTTPTISKTDAGDSAASFTALANNTTKATTTGTVQIIHEGGEHIYSGEMVSLWTRECPPIGPSESFVYELLSALQGTPKLSGLALVEEIGG